MTVTKFILKLFYFYFIFLFSLLIFSIKLMGISNFFLNFVFGLSPNSWWSEDFSLDYCVKLRDKIENKINLKY